MAGEDRPRTPAEQTALEELERLREAIEKSRRRRREANDAFDTFVRSFGTRPPSADRGAASPPAIGTLPNVRAQPRTSEPPALTLGPPPGATAARRVEPSAPAPKSIEPAPKPIEPGAGGPRPIEPDASPHSLDLPQPGESRTPEPIVPAALTATAPEVAPSRGKLILAAVAVAAVAVSGWYLMTRDGREGAQQVPAAAPAAAPAPASSPAPKAVEPPASKAEITTVRRVWLRVTVDGEPAIEREFDANARIPLDPKERLVIRAGDAGALRVSIDGKDQGAFGPDGIPVTRAFPIPPAPPR
jgi:hypothetical protein